MKKFLKVLAGELRVEGKRMLQAGEELLVDEPKAAAFFGAISGTLGALANSIEAALEKTDDDSDVIDSILGREEACVKCGSTHTNCHHHEGQYSCNFSDNNDVGTDREHLHYTCCACGFSWTGPMKDATNQESNGEKS